MAKINNDRSNYHLSKKGGRCCFFGKNQLPEIKVQKREIGNATTATVTVTIKAK